MKLLNTHKKLVNLAVASVVAGGFAMTSVPAHAINVSQNNIGQVALFPYYTVKNGFDTLLSVVNTSDKTVAFKIRFREALNSREVRDFNVIMSPYDVWNAVVTKDTAGTGAVVRTKDNTCTSPVLPASPTVPEAREIAFTTAAFDGTNVAYPVDGAGTAMTRVQEGYLEILEMGASAADTANTANTIEYGAKHDASGVPHDCASVDAAFANANNSGARITTAPFTNFSAPLNLLKGFSSLINVGDGTAIDANPTMLEGWQTQQSVLFQPGDLEPNIGSGKPNNFTFWAYNGQPVGGTITSPWDQVSALLSATDVINEYAADGAGVFTDWVVTYPTKHHYVDLAVSTTVSAGNAPFAENFNYKVGSALRGQSCDKIDIAYWNREEKKNPTSSGFSPAGSNAQFCYEVNVLTFNGGYVLGTSSDANHPNHYNQNTADVGARGWADITLTNTGNLALPGVTLGGLPVIGFAAIVRSVGASSANYGDSEPHTYQRSM